METKNIQLNVVTSERTYTNRYSGSSTYKAVIAVKVNDKQWEVLKTHLDTTAKSWTWLDSLDTRWRIIEVTISGGIGYSVWRQFFQGYFMALAPRMDSSRAYNFKGLRL